MFVLSHENIGQQTSCKSHFLPTIEMIGYNVMIDEKHFFLINQ